MRSGSTVTANQSASILLLIAATNNIGAFFICRTLDPKCNKSWASWQEVLNKFLNSHYFVMSVENQKLNQVLGLVVGTLPAPLCLVFDSPVQQKPSHAYSLGYVMYAGCLSGGPHMGHGKIKTAGPHRFVIGPC
ncbi:hypothetical protein VNO77_14660 [Canavalia gladiata]|uniref:Uncharacterized protein n=1 Tax=Canavalia gladiata TaxID=3824 RepID=A0AAN9M216_CANGL